MVDKIFKEAEFCVLYKPMSDEVDPHDLTADFPSRQKVVPQDHTVDPQMCAKDILSEYGDKKGCILVPGRKFDIYGGRQGRGKGWYDRFLSFLPNEWVRIGVCCRSEFSDKRLKLNVWDQVMDYVVVLHSNSFIIHETHARF